MVLVASTVVAVWLAQAAHRRPDPAGTYQAALDAYLAGDMPQLEAHLAELRSRQWQPLRVQLLEGMSDLATGRWDAAARNLESATADAELRPSALGLLGEAYYQQGRLADAAHVLQTALSLDPQLAIARRWLAAAYYDLGANDLALEQLDRVLQQDTADPRPYRLRGLIQKDFEQYQEAIESYLAALRLQPGDADRREIAEELADCQIRLLRHDDALRTLSEAPETANTLALRAQCHYALNNVGIAKQELTRVLALDPRHLEGLDLSGRIALDAGDVAAAADQFEKAAEFHPAEFEVRYRLAGVYRSLGREADAELQMAEVQRLQALRREFTDLHHQAFRDTRDAGLRYRLGVVATELGKWELAAEWFEAALALNPDYRDAASALSDLQKSRALPRNSGTD
jgi:tetratricopeptide (TPR) repeat protein